MRGPGAEGRDRRRLISGILLAAGLSSRFGRQKLLEPWRGEALVRRAARSFLEAGLAPVIAVVSGDRHLADALAGLPVTIETNPQPERGINTSIRIGVGALPRATTAALIGVADQPLLTAEAILKLVQAFEPGKIVGPRYGDHGGNPVIFDRRFFPELMRLMEADRGGQVVVAAHPEAVIEVELPVSMGTDIDSPDDWF
ncbi:MAG: nucleotidyltransferase family protein [Chloroflexi bacterium]|nr:MAG: nucleotidyltransferase family protein [Chloroflexota bacterium]TMG14677.1 MAG: nucleotidyltransferase family protein [Chloroflexota bacterium]